MRVIAEFTSEPFEGEGDVPAHARYAIEAVRRSGLEHEFGPLGTSLVGEADAVLPALRTALAAALEHGATRVTAQVERADD